MLQRERTLCGIQSPRRLFQLQCYRLILSELTTEPQFSGQASIPPTRSLRMATSTSCTRPYDQPPPVLPHPKPQCWEKLNQDACPGQPNLTAQDDSPRKPTSPLQPTPKPLLRGLCEASGVLGAGRLAQPASGSLGACHFHSVPSPVVLSLAPSATTTTFQSP